MFAPCSKTQPTQTNTTVKIKTQPTQTNTKVKIKTNQVRKQAAPRRKTGIIDRIVDRLYEAYLYSIKLNMPRSIQVLMGEKACKSLELNSTLLEAQVAAIIKKCRPLFDEPLKAELKKFKPSQLYTLELCLENNMIEAMSELSMALLPVAIKAAPILVEHMSNLEDDVCLA